MAKGNLKPAPFYITPSIVRRVLQVQAHNSRVVEVPVLPVKLADGKRRTAKVKDAGAVDPSISRREVGQRSGRSSSESRALPKVSAPSASRTAAQPVVGSNPTPANSITARLREIIAETLGENPVSSPVRSAPVTTPVRRKRKAKAAAAQADQIDITPGKVRAVVAGATAYGSCFDLVEGRQAQFCAQCDRVRKAAEVAGCQSQWCSLRKIGAKGGQRA